MHLDLRLMALFGAIFLGCPKKPVEGGAEPEPTEAQVEAKAVSSMVLPPSPDWTDRYRPAGGPPPALRISAVMTKHGISRLQAVELQNHLRDQLRSPEPPTQAVAYQEALRRVLTGRYESGLDPVRLEKASFIVVFDLDETLYDQGGLGALSPEAFKTCGGVEVPTDAAPRRVVPVPAWDETIRRIRALGGEVVIFSANLDEVSLANVGALKLDGAPLLGHPQIAGVLTNSHLILQDRTEPPGSPESPVKGQPVAEPSKDLRILDESLNKVIIVDDNPTRLFQPHRTCLFPKFEAEIYCTLKPEDPFRKAWDHSMSAVKEEISESVDYMAYVQRFKDKPIGFAQAYLPYSQAAKPVLDALLAAGYTRKEANEIIRTEPERVPSRW